MAKSGEYMVQQNMEELVPEGGCLMNMVFYEIEHGINANHFSYGRNIDQTFPLHMHRSYEMVLVLKGEMIMQIDSEIYHLREGDLILVKPHRIHSYETESGKTNEILACIFSGDLIAAISDALSRYHLPSIVLHNVPQLYRDVFLSAQDCNDVAGIKGFLYLLCSLFYRELDCTREDANVVDNSLLRDMFIYIENNVDKPCTLHELARELRYNEAYLSRMFRKSVGVPYSDYVQNIKINHACYLLRNTSESIFNIAMKCGYATQSSFYRSFKQLVGMSPNEYRLKKEI